MKTIPRLGGTLLLLAVTTVELVCCAKEADWYEAEREVTALLWRSNMPIAQLVSNITARVPTNGPEAMLKLYVLMHAGIDEQAIVTLRELKQVCPRLENSQVSAVYYAACDQEQAWDVAQALLETFAESASELTLENRLLKHWLDSGRSIDQIDRWLAARPSGIDSFWVKERFRFAQVQGRGEELLKQLSDGVRLNPGNVTNAIVFLDALLYAGRNAKQIDLSWFETVVKPERASDAKTLAERLQQLESWQAALAYFRQAIAIPLTEQEIQELGSTRQVLLEPEQLRGLIAVTAHEGMAECFLKLGQAEAAQREMVEAAEIRSQLRLGSNPLLAGRVQAESGQRTTERRIAEAEKKSENELEYWRDRAMYYRGRQEFGSEEQALKKTLSLTKPQARPQRTSKGYGDPRAFALADYAQFLARHGREQESVALLRRELGNAPANTVSSERAAYLLAFDFDKQITPADVTLWNWLSNRPTWGQTEERLLWRMLDSAAGPGLAVSAPAASPADQSRTPEKVPNEKLAQCFTRAETLAAGGNPTRAYTLGWIMNRMGFPKRSLPLLKTAVKQATDRELQQQANFALLESYLDTGAWKQAEAVFPEASGQLSAREIPEWYSRLALIAAREGFKEDAMRLWRRTANLSPTAITGLVELANLGLRDELVAFYRVLQNEMPSSHAPTRALDLLEERAKPSADR